MNTRPIPSLVARFAFLAIAGVPIPMFAQTTPTATPASTAAARPVSASAKDSEEAEVIVLSPFDVTTSRDVGFAAASAQAGGRLATDLKDTPVAYSVINRDLIDALGLTDLTAAADWTTNSMKFYDGAGGGDTFNITSPVSTRGVTANNLRQRNFFVYYGPMDSYSIERYDFGRGPNQVLFGNGTVGGTSVSMTKRPRFDRRQSSLELNYGSWGNARGVVDINQPITDKLAVRLSAVLADRDGWRDGEFEKTKGLFATAAYKLGQNTEIRIEGEIGRQSRRIPYAELRDRFSGWNGVTTFNGQMTEAMRNGTAAPATGPLLQNNGDRQGVNRRGTGYYVYDAYSGQNLIMQYTNDPFTRGGGDGANTPIGGAFQVGGVSMGTNDAPILNALGVPGNRFNTAIANSAFAMPSEEFTLAPDAPNIVQRFKDAQITVSHKVGDSLFFEVAGDVNRVHNNANLLENSGLITTYIDINRLLPNGAANPHFLQPYADAQYRIRQNKNDAESVRGAIAYIKDLGRAGNYSFNLMGGLTHRFTSVRNQFLQPGTSEFAADHRGWGTGANGVRFRQYWNEPTSYRLPTGPIGYLRPAAVVGTTTITSVAETVTPFFAQDVTSFNNANEADEDYNYVLGATNAKFFSGRWIVLAALRMDQSKQKVRYTKQLGDYPTNWDGQTIIFRPDAPADWSTLTYTPTNATTLLPTGPAVAASIRPRIGNNANNAGEPRYASDQFQDDFSPPIVESSKQTPSVGTVVHATKWMSLSANYAEAFAFNSSAAPDPNNQLLPPVSGKGWDASTRFSFFKERLTFTAGYYANEEYGNYIDPTSVTGQINGLYAANRFDDASAEGRNRRDAGNISSVVRDTRTRIVDGYEFELTANLARGWRLTANYALPKVWQKSFAPITREYVAARQQLFVQILQDAGGMIDPSQPLPGAPGRAVINPAVTPLLTQERTNAINSYNALYTNMGAFISDLQMADYQDVGNIFTDYKFQSGFLKDLKIGAGVNYRGSKIVGYRNADQIVNPANPLQSIDDASIDAHNPVWAPSYYTVTATLGYSWKLKNRREIIVNLRVGNLLNNQDVIYAGGVAVRPPGGDVTSPARQSVPSAFAYQQPRSFYLTTTLRL